MRVPLCGADVIKKKNKQNRQTNHVGCNFDQFIVCGTRIELLISTHNSKRTNGCNYISQQITSLKAN